MKRNILLILLTVFMACPAMAVRAPQRTNLAEWAKKFQSGGLRPSTIDFSHLRTALRARKSSRNRLLKAAAPLPRRWDSRENGWVTPIKNQGAYGTCWAFATMAALETAGLKATAGAVTNDYSENHMATHNVGFKLGFDDGGNNQLAAALLTSWRDPLLENEDPYPAPDSRVNLPPCCHVQNIVQLPERYCPFVEDDGAQYESGVRVLDDNQEVDEAYKRAVMEYGAVAIGYLHSDDNYNSSTAAHYLSRDNYRESSLSGWHAVTLIGWDDDYPAENFKEGKCPPGNGAFLVKNSWGTSSHTDQGCSWISYYDETVLYSAGAAYPQPEEPDNFGRIYQYDPCGQVQTWNSADDDSETGFENWCANVFVATATGIVEAVGFYAMSADTQYQLKICQGCTVGPDTGECVLEQSGVVANAGFTTIRLREAIPLSVAGEKFAVVLWLESPGTEYPMPVECNSEEWCRCTANAGESFMSKDGINWTDFQKYDESGNFCIKAYTKFGSDGESQQLIVDWSPRADYVNIPVGGTCRFAVNLTEDATDLTYEWKVNGVKVDCSSAAFDFSPSFANHGYCAVECIVRMGAIADVHIWTVKVNAELHVEADGSSIEEPDGSPDRPFAAIQDAVRVAIADDVVLVGPGIYYGLVQGPVVAIEIRSTEGPEVTVLDAQGNNNCYDGSKNVMTTLSGFTLRNANMPGCYGGGVYGGRITNCIISNCWAAAGGGAASATLVNCLVINNGADYDGGGICDSVAYDCLFVGNYSGRFGSAASGYYFGCELYGCTVCGNCCSVPDGGAIDSGSLCQNSIVWGNFDLDGHVSNWQRYQHEGVEYVPAFFNCCTAPTGFFDYGGCTTADPRFVDAVHGDYHLMANSPCIDAGDNYWVFVDCDLDGTNRIFGARVDMGCYEYCRTIPGWPVPEVNLGDSRESESVAVSNAMISAGFDEKRATALKSLVQYNAVSAWAADYGLAPSDLAASATAFISPALAASGLLNLRPEDLNIVGFNPDPIGHEWVMKLSLEPYYNPLTVNAELLKAAVGISGAETPNGRFSSDGIGVSVSPEQDGIRVLVTPPDGKQTYFLKSIVR